MTGSLLVFLSCSILGFYRAHLLQRRVAWIRASIHGLQRLETEIAFAATPLQMALLRVARVSAEDGDFFAGWSAVDDESNVRSDWRRCIEHLRRSAFLHATELEALRELGETLGSSDRDDQVKHLRLTMQQLSAAADQAAEDCRRFRSMWRSLGVLGGALVVLLLY